MSGPSGRDWVVAMIGVVIAVVAFGVLLALFVLMSGSQEATEASHPWMRYVYSGLGAALCVGILVSQVLIARTAFSRRLDNSAGLTVLRILVVAPVVEFVLWLLTRADAFGYLILPTVLGAWLLLATPWTPVGVADVTDVVARAVVPRRRRERGEEEAALIEHGRRGDEMERLLEEAIDERGDGASVREAAQDG